MKTKTIELYSLSELSDKAQKRAHNDYLQFDFYAWHDSNNETLKQFCEVFPVHIDRRDNVHVTDHKNLHAGQVAELSGHRLAKYIWNNFADVIFTPKQYWICDGRPNTVGENSKKRVSHIFVVPDNCPLTGYCIDNDILEPMVKFLRHPDEQTNFEELLNDCIDSFNKAVQKDIDYSQSFEYFKETCEANEYTFTESGKMENI